jgi:hypothetical protein
MKPIAKMSQAELGAFVQSHMAKKGIDVVLSGGASVSVYSEGEYVSKDLDLVNVNSEKRSVIVEAMSDLGFAEEGRHFTHPKSKHLIEFPPGPLAVGAEPVKSIHEVRLSTGLLRVVSPTDCVKDRLAHYFHWHDRQALAQAILVARNHSINFREVARWAQVEGMRDEFQAIRNQFPRVPLR